MTTVTIARTCVTLCIYVRAKCVYVWTLASLSSVLNSVDCIVCHTCLGRGSWVCVTGGLNRYAATRKY